MSQVYATNTISETAITTPTPVQNYLYFSSTTQSSVPSGLSILGSSTQLDGYSGTTQSTTTAASFFTSTIVFSLDTPIYTDDDADVMTFQVALGSANQTQTFNIICTLTNLGQTVSSPIYSLTLTNGIVQVDVNKWFTLRSPGSQYTFTVMGFNAQMA